MESLVAPAKAKAKAKAYKGSAQPTRNIANKNFFTLRISLFGIIFFCTFKIAPNYPSAKPHLLRSTVLVDHYTPPFVFLSPRRKEKSPRNCGLFYACSFNGAPCHQCNPHKIWVTCV
jgi:hypothetical protein